jgi:hypothetical protein
VTLNYRTQKICLHAQVSGQWSGVYDVCVKHTVRCGQTKSVMIPAGVIF